MYLLSGAWTKENDFNQLVTALIDTKLVEEFHFDVYEKKHQGSEKYILSNGNTIFFMVFFKIK